MSDQSLQVGLKALREDLARSYPERAQYDIASTTIDRLDSLLAASACPCLQDESGVEVKPGCPEHDPQTGPRPLLDRKMLQDLLFFQILNTTPDEASRVTDMVMQMARPMPTRRDIAVAIDPEAFDERIFNWIHWGDRREQANTKADAVLALLNGSKS